MTKILLSLVFFFCAPAQAALSMHEADVNAIRTDLQLILREAGLEPHSIDFETDLSQKNDLEKNLVSIECYSRQVHLRVHARSEEWAATFYLGLQKLGFLFPHPRLQISPKWDRIYSQCGRTFEWKPRLHYRGFHLHTQHPSEWVHGFLMGKQSIADAMIRWIARNGQNVVNLVLLRTVDQDELQRNLKSPFALARSMGILTGINVSMNMQQQKAFRLINEGYISSWLKYKIDHEQVKSSIQSSIHSLARRISFDFMTIELGSSEFTSTDYQSTLSWIQVAQDVLTREGRQLFFKIHISSNQKDPRYGNYNFLPTYAENSVGIWPHTVMFYGLGDRSTPVYGRSDFTDIRDLAIQEKDKRPVWYYPETSYFVAMDIDVPLFLTDYLVARSQDLDYLENSGISGQINFTTGQELGYWLMDWTVALLVNSESRGDPMIGLELLGEDVQVWKRIIEFQTHYFKQLGLISILSSTTPLDEIPYVGHSVHERVLLKTLADGQHYELLQTQIQTLESALQDLPPLKQIRNRELRLMLEVTWARISHALDLRRALLGVLGSEQRIASLKRAENTRTQALGWMEEIQQNFNRYPEARVFYHHSNPTSYSSGYGWAAVRLHFWKREERMILGDYYSPFFMNIYDLARILF